MNDCVVHSLQFIIHGESGESTVARMQLVIEWGDNDRSPPNPTDEKPCDNIFVVRHLKINYTLVSVWSIPIPK